MPAPHNVLNGTAIVNPSASWVADEKEVLDCVPLSNV